MGSDDRKLDVEDILDKVTTGWITPPNQPRFEVESNENPIGPYIINCPDDGIIFIKKNYVFRREKISRTREHRVWEFNIVIIAQSEILLQGIFDQAREVFDRYTSSPWSTSTIGTGTTYSFAGIEMGEEDERTPGFVMDCKVYLAEYIAAVVIA